jgi:hypothetical protein
VTRGHLAGVLALFALASASGAQDTVELLDGTQLEGRVVLETPERVIVRKGSRDREVERAKVKRVESRAHALDELLASWLALEKVTAEATLELARKAKASGLSGEAEVLAMRVLAVDPSNEAAHLFLEHERRGENWILRRGSRRLSLERRVEQSRDWGEAWEFTTSHYVLATNLELATACDLALELELYYRNFYAWFAIELGLYEVLEPMASHVHADKSSFPDESGRIGYFDGQANRLVELATQDNLLGVLTHEATHQILYNTARAARVSSSAVPPWLDEGLAEFCSSARRGFAGRASYALESRYDAHFVTHRDAKKPYDLARILTFSTGDFAASSKADLKYAEAYTLVHFCLLGDQGAHRRPFLDFLGTALRGKGSSTDFKNALLMDERRLEKAWNEYVGRR